MRAYNHLVFDDIISGTATTWYSAADRAYELGQADFIAVAAVVSGVSGTTPTLTVQAEHCCDGRSWVATPFAEIGVGIANEGVYVGWRDETFGFMSYLRFKITLGGTTPACRLKLFVTGRTAGGRDQ